MIDFDSLTFTRWITPVALQLLIKTRRSVPVDLHPWTYSCVAHLPPHLAACTLAGLARAPCATLLSCLHKSWELRIGIWFTDLLSSKTKNAYKKATCWSFLLEVWSLEDYEKNTKQMKKTTQVIDSFKICEKTKQWLILTPWHSPGESHPLPYSC